MRMYDGGDERTTVKSGNLTMSEGGRSIAYSEEDPFVRSNFEAGVREGRHDLKHAQGALSKEEDRP